MKKFLPSILAVVGIIVVCLGCCMAAEMVLAPSNQMPGVQGSIMLGGEVIAGQDEAEVGELVRFLAEAEIVKWQCLPNSSDWESYGDNGQNFVISFRKPGVYTIIVAAYDEGGLDITTHQITVKGPVVVIPDVVVVIPPNMLDELVQRSENWAVKYGIERDILVTLSANFQKVAREIEDGDLTSPGEVITRTVKINKRLKVDEGLIAELQAYLTSQADAGNLKTLDQHKAVWSAISLGFKNAADLL